MHLMENKKALFDSLLAQDILDSIEDQIAVIGRDGRIEYCNQSWRDFACMNGMAGGYDWVGINYLNVCRTAAEQGDADGKIVAEGIVSVMEAARTSFVHEYPCHSPDTKRWFMMRLFRLRRIPDLFVVMHHDITRRRVSENQVAQLNEELARLSLSDQLTGLCNRRRLDQALADELRRAERYGKTFAGIMFDVDRFKQINDDHGHQVGDSVLIRVASSVRRVCRESDILGRWGGDEFMILMPESDGEAALLVAAKIGAELAVPEERIPAHTCSFGVTDYRPGDTSESFLIRADAALYAAKKTGRNRVGRT